MDDAEEQPQRWNGAAGHAWAASQAVLDRLFEPLADRLADLAAARRPDQLLNVRCEIEVVRPAFDRYVHGDAVRFTAACWMVSARADANARSARAQPSASQDAPGAQGVASVLQDEAVPSRRRRRHGAEPLGEDGERARHDVDGARAT